MKHVTIGTAGHVDHGKTELVRRLTGVDTDRLPEEKQRGMTIDLGFAPLTLPSGRRISIIDVPGHERFVKTMVAGVTGIDFVLLVVAADEGVMPQTREHLDILTLLEVSKGVVALTKVDLIDSEEWLELVKEEVREALSRSSLREAPIIPVSSITGQGISELLNELEKTAEEVSANPFSEVLRLPVDRVFLLTGHGVIVTGTLVGGEIVSGVDVEVLPTSRKARVRGVQVHGRPVTRASAGERVALNLVGVEKDQIKRGDVIVVPGTIPTSRLLDATVKVAETAQGLKHDDRVRFLAGTSEVMARVRLIGDRQLLGGEKGYAQLRLEEPVVVIPGDRFILRRFSPVETVGGGCALALNPPHRRPLDEDSLRRLKVEEQGSMAEKIELFMVERAEKRCRQGVPPPLTVATVARETFISEREVAEALREASSRGITWLGKDGLFLPVSIYDPLKASLLQLLQRRCTENPFQPWVEREEARSSLAPSWETREFNAFLLKMNEEGQIALEGSRLLSPDWQQLVSDLEARPDVRQVEAAYARDGLNPPKPDEVARETALPQAVVEKATAFLLDRGKLTNLGGGICVHTSVVEKVHRELPAMLAGKEWVATGEVRDVLNCNRRMAVALLEYFDQQGWTERKGDVRRILPK